MIPVSRHIPRRKAAFVAEPLERGFGLTLGDSPRRAEPRIVAL